MTVATARPLTGGGFGTFSPPVFARYSPDVEWRAAHSIYFEVLAEQGYPGEFLFLAILVFCILVSAAAYALVEHRLIVFLQNLAKNRIPRLMGINRPAVDAVLRGRHRNLFE